MMARKKNELIPNTQENINGYSDTTSSMLQKDVGFEVSTSSSYSNKINYELIEYRMKQLEQNVDELKAEIQQPIFKKLEKYKWVLGIVGTIIISIIACIFRLYSTNLDNKFNNIMEKLDNNNKIIEAQSKEISELNKKINILEYANNINKQEQTINKK